MLQLLCSLPNTGIYAIINESDKKVLIVSSKDLTGSLFRLIKGIQEGHATLHHTLKNDLLKLDFRLLESFKDSNRLPFRKDYYERYYRKQGYTLYGITGVVHKYKAIIEVPDLTKPICHVVLKSSRGSRITVGIFKSMKEAIEFKDAWYGKEYINDVVYSQNDLTKSVIPQ